jgi:DHA1 family bicyclomycin/chloramphenicol resistance-like MFS transporter
MATLLGARLVQAFGAAAGIVIARAMIRDSFDGVALARVMALVTMAFALVLYALDLRGSPADE